MAKKAESREVDDLAERMIRVLESQRRLGGDAYPPTLERLAELCGVRASDPNVLKVAGKKSFKERAVVAWNENRKPARRALVILASPQEVDQSVEEAAFAILLGLLRGIAESKTPALSVSRLKDKLTERLKKPFQKAIEDGRERRTLPPEVGWLPNGGSQLVFLMSAVRTSAPRPMIESDGVAGRARLESQPTSAEPSNGTPGRLDAVMPAVGRAFAPAFRAAFDHLDRENRSTNFVRLLDLRRALPQFDRQQFDAGLRQLRLDDEFTLDSHEGRHGPLTDDEREAGVREAGSLLVYASRRS